MQIFDARHIGQQIAAGRKAKNMTQSALADQLNVSYQAVSNWERSQSLPDIDKYAQLAKVLDLNLDDLIGAEGARTVTIMDDDSAPVDARTLAEAAPVMKPAQVEQKAARLSPNLTTLKEIAPFLSSTTLKEKVMAQIAQPGFAQMLVQIAPFMATADLDAVIAAGVPADDDHLEELFKLAPFRQTTSNDQLGSQLLKARGSLNAVKKLLPFMSHNVVNELFTTRAQADLTADDLTALAPFVSETVLADHVRQLSRQGNGKAARKFMPFLSEATLVNLLAN
ncbi:helix-turn-helix domain-containing protein [Lacticaseibacillus hegangensis]|uniref:Helix-turn-helix domain-containing protein n=1 Tax=Lacticaseibacillus hegangensis TaxID=2486010 RepID=A0ABW4CW31_9LACO|nr:helix-turn-helix transcriptional regulator [Lacticaseibacillus hegangensis]